MTSRKRISEILVDNRQMSQAQADQIFAIMQAGRTGKSEQELILEREFAAEKDIAAAVGMTENQVSKILAKLRKKLRKHLEKEGITV